MHTQRMITVLAILCALLFAGIRAQTQTKLGFLVLAPDRGFMGNEETREAFEEYRQHFTASLVYVTREETKRFIDEGIAALKKEGVAEIVAVPLFVSTHQPLYAQAISVLNAEREDSKLSITIGNAMTESYLLSEIIADRVAVLGKDPSKEQLVLIAQGTDTSSIESDLMNVFHQIHDRYPFAGHATVAVSARGGEAQYERLSRHLADAQAKDLTPIIVICDFSTKMDGMMTFAAGVKSVAKKYNARFDGADLTPHPNVTLWLAKESNSHVPITAQNLGVIFMPHGSTHVWNRTMIDAIESLQKKYMIEPVFSMGDPPLIEKAVRKLEKRGARAITVVRVFSLESSFRDGVEYVLGLRTAADHSAHGHGGEVHVPSKIRSGCTFYTLGGLEASPLFAEALLDRAYEVSKQSSKETIILLAHGADTEKDNDHWLENLASIASHMKNVAAEKKQTFRDIRYATWREDWPEVRKKAIEDIRSMVTDASTDGGTAIVIPARTAREGQEQEWLKGLSFVYNGNGFAPHEKFVQWVEDQIQRSLLVFNGGKNVTTPALLPAEHSQHHGHH